MAKKKDDKPKEGTDVRGGEKTDARDGKGLPGTDGEGSGAAAGAAAAQDAPESQEDRLPAVADPIDIPAALKASVEANRALDAGLLESGAVPIITGIDAGGILGGPEDWAEDLSDLSLALQDAIRGFGLKRADILDHRIRPEGGVVVVTRGGRKLAWPEDRGRAASLTPEEKDGVQRQAAPRFFPEGFLDSGRKRG